MYTLIYRLKILNIYALKYQSLSFCYFISPTNFKNFLPNCVARQ